jgi:LAO/AO transport system kinase
LSRSTSPKTLVSEALAGNRRALARLISAVENETPHANDALKALYPYTGKAYIVGITGAPGTGKSCLVTALAQHLRRQNKTIGIIAVDPTSPFSGGAVLGDRLRMRDLSGDAGVFIRSMASRGHLGGLARATYDVMRVMDAAGFDYVIVETVGAGQNEVEIVKAADTTVVVEAPGLGDDIQAIKAGILEIADILVVNKSDHPSAQNTVRALQAMLDLGHRQRTVAHHGQLMVQTDSTGAPEYDFRQTPIVQTIAINGDGVPELAAALEEHRAYLAETGMKQDRERVRLQSELIVRLKEALLKNLLDKTPPEQLEYLLTQLQSRETDPVSAVRILLGEAKLR